MNDCPLGRFRLATADDARGRLAASRDHIEPLSKLENAAHLAEQATEIGALVEGNWLQTQADLMVCLGRTVHHIYYVIQILDERDASDPAGLLVM